MGNGKSIAGDQRAVPTQGTHVWYRTFMTEYPSGLQTLHEFKTLLGLQGLNQKANKHVDQVYNTFDTNKVRSFTFHFIGKCYGSVLFPFFPYKIALSKMCASH